MLEDIESILIDEDKLAKRIKEIGQEISEDFAGEEIMLVGILNGARVFMSDLIRQIRFPVYIE